jgi:hypothetical protein
MTQFIARLSLIFGCLCSITSYAIEPIQAGESYVTRFSGIEKDNITGKVIINLNGTVGSIIDIRRPKKPPLGQHWLNEPQRAPIKAIDAGQVFGIAIDDKTPATIYLTATSKFGLHRNHDNSDWLAGMWGKDAGPGTIYRLQAANDYQPEIFATITLNGRNNSGAALGNIAYDAKNKQLFVTDLETGMIHRIDAKTGKLLSYFDHGIDGRSVFLDKVTQKTASLAVIEFNPKSSANIQTCKTTFDLTPECWNLADPRRRVWGIGIYSKASDTTRVYYAVWSDINDKQATIWSIGLDRNGDFNIKDVQREFKLPHNNVTSQIAVSDLAFSNQGELLVAENGPLQNLGLDKVEPFSKPHLARVLIYTQNTKGIWSVKGRYNIGNITSNIKQDKATFTSSAGGVDFGYGYTANHIVDLAKIDEYVWATGDALCSPKGPCYELSSNSFTDEDEVHGIQGMPKSSYVTKTKEDDFFIESYMIDTDINILPNGDKSQEQAIKNDATKIGDIEIVKTSLSAVPIPVHLTQISAFHRKYESNVHNRSISTPIHYRKWSHKRWGSHKKTYSHYRRASHNSLRSHNKYGSHYRLDSHYRLWSHNRFYSHQKYGSHDRRASHVKYGSHSTKRSHLKYGSHNRRISHFKYDSHSKKRSHIKYGSHNRKVSHWKYGSHSRKLSHLRKGSHNKRASHFKKGSHDRRASHLKKGSTVHNARISHLKKGSHNRRASHLKKGSTIHSVRNSHLRKGSHNRHASHLKKGSTVHSVRSSHLRKGSHNRHASHLKKGSTVHSARISHLKKGSHNRRASHNKYGSHNKLKSQIRQNF